MTREPVLRDLPEGRPYIHGGYRDAHSGKRLADLDPATGEALCVVQEADAKDVARAVESAQEGLAEWSAMPGAQRGHILMNAARLLREHGPAVAALEVRDSGKPIQEVEAVDLASSAACLAYYAGLAASIQDQQVDLGRSYVTTRREPLGVCAAIGAWHAPLQIACWRSAPALACGNAMIFKPAELTPLTALRLAEIYSEVGLPHGTFNVLPGGRALAGALTEHLEIAKVFPTRELAAGETRVAGAAARREEPILVPGGKAPLVVFADAELDTAIAAATRAAFQARGESGIHGIRVLVERPIQQAFLERLLARTRRLRLGDPLDPETDIGPLISRAHLDQALDQIARAREEAARLVSGGGRPEDPALARGYFVEPTIFTDCTDEMTLVHDSTFGPVLPVLAFDEEAEAVARANQTGYGPAAGVFTRDLARAQRVVGRLQAGICWINGYDAAPVEGPPGGFRAAAPGRETGLLAIESYTRAKRVYVEIAEPDPEP